jgi:hypothetical protein
MSEPSPHACPGMTQVLADDRVPLIYVPKFREWAVSVDGGPAMQVISHCPWCGDELPASLRDQYFDTLERQGLEPDDPDLPLHLRSDAWWRLAKP